MIHKAPIILTLEPWQILHQIFQMFVPATFQVETSWGCVRSQISQGDKLFTKISIMESWDVYGTQPCLKGLRATQTAPRDYVRIR